MLANLTAKLAFGGGADCHCSHSSCNHLTDTKLFNARRVTAGYAGATLQETDVTSVTEKDPKHHIENMKKRSSDVVDHLRQDIRKVDERQLKAMFETSAEVLGGLIKAFSDHESKNEAAWRRDS